MGSKLDALKSGIKHIGTNRTKYFIVLLGLLIVLCEMIEYFMSVSILDEMDKDSVDSDGYYVSIHHGLESSLINFIELKNENIEDIPKIKQSDIEKNIQDTINNYNKKLKNVVVKIFEKESTCNESIYSLTDIDDKAKEYMEKNVEAINKKIAENVETLLNTAIDLDENDIALTISIKESLKCSNSYNLMKNKLWLMLKVIFFTLLTTIVLLMVGFTEMSGKFQRGITGFLSLFLFGVAMFESGVKIFETEKLSAKCRKKYTKDYIRFFMYVFPSIKLSIFSIIFVYALLGPGVMAETLKQKARQLAKTAEGVGERTKKMFSSRLSEQKKKNLVPGMTREPKAAF